MKMQNYFYLLLGILTLLPHCSAQSKPVSLEGKITLAPSLASKLNPSDVLFIFAFSVSPESQPSQEKITPVAVQKIAPVSFPVEYQLTERDVMFPERRFEGSLFITARVDKDGNAKTVEKGDLEGAFKKNPARVGSGRVDMVIDQEK